MAPSNEMLFTFLHTTHRRHQLENNGGSNTGNGVSNFGALLTPETSQPRPTRNTGSIRFHRPHLGPALVLVAGPLLNKMTKRGEEKKGKEIKIAR